MAMTPRSIDELVLSRCSGKSPEYRLGYLCGANTGDVTINPHPPGTAAHDAFAAGEKAGIADKHLVVRPAPTYEGPDRRRPRYEVIGHE